MAKKRKTRAQKKLSDFRHNFSHRIVNQPIIKPQIQFQAASSSEIKQGAGLTTTYPYLVKDLSKTAILTFIILSAQIVLYYLLISHTLKIPGLAY